MPVGTGIDVPDEPKPLVGVGTGSDVPDGPEPAVEVGPPIPPPKSGHQGGGGGQVVATTPWEGDGASTHGPLGDSAFPL